MIPFDGDIAIDGALRCRLSSRQGRFGPVSPSGAMCTAPIDVMRTSRIATVDVAVGRRAGPLRTWFLHRVTCWFP